jgi:type IX secretion system substrate protein
MKHLISILFIFTCSFFVKGQDTFHKLIPLEHPVSRFMSVLPTDSCYYVIGTFTDSTFRAGVLWGKINLDGDLLALKTIRHPGWDYFNDNGDIRSTPQGLLYNAGSLNVPFSTQVIFYLYDQEGDTLLTRQYRSILYPDADFVVPKNIYQRVEGGFAIACVHHTDDNPKNSDISLLLIDTSYQIENYFSYAHSSKHEIPASLLLDEDGGYIIGAERTNDGQVFLNYYNRTLIIKTDPSGNQLWQYLSPPGVLQDAAHAMIKTPDSGLVVASGAGQEIGNNPNYHTLVWDGLIFKLDADRNVMWNTPLRGSDVPGGGGTELTEMVEATDGNGYVASGIVYEITPEHPNGYYTSWLVKVSPEGDSLWSRRYTYFDGEFVAPEVWDMKATPDGGYVLVGFSRNVGLPAPGWIMKVDSFGCLIPGCHLTDATEEKETTAPLLAIYPNPVGDFLNFQLRGVPFAKNATFRIVNMQGTVVQEIKSVNVQATVTIPVSGWPAGAYFLQCLENGVVICSEKFVKQ